jgi:MFS family permease
METKNLTNDIKRTADGLSLMILFTILWTVIAEAALDNWTYRLFGIVFLIIVSTFTLFYLKFNKIAKLTGDKVKVEESPEDKKRGNRFVIIFVTEGVAIFIAKNILVNINMDQLFIPCFALIVGLHFFPLAMLFKREIYYYVGSWITLISVIGIFLTIYKTTDQNLITAFTGFGCAAGTSLMGAYMVYYGNKNSQLLIGINLADKNIS